MSGLFATTRRWIEDKVLLPNALEEVRDHTRNRRPVWDRLPEDWSAVRKRSTAKADGSRWAFLLHAAAHPEEYYLCSSCGDGPWHFTWEEPGKRSRYALGGCCSGAD